MVGLRNAELLCWWLGLSGAQATISCGEHQHRLRWERGRLEALDHGDPEDERALAALGGEPFACIELLDAWERHKDDIRALVLGTRGATDRLHIDPDSFPRSGGGPSRLQRARPPGAPRLARRPGNTAVIGGGWTGYAPGRPGPAGVRASKQARSEAELIWLLNLGGGIADRLLATVAATWSRRIRSGQSGLNKARPQLHVALHSRAFAALRPWLGEPELTAELIMIDATEPRY